MGGVPVCFLSLRLRHREREREKSQEEREKPLIVVREQSRESEEREERKEGGRTREGGRKREVEAFSSHCALSTPPFSTSLTPTWIQW